VLEIFYFLAQVAHERGEKRLSNLPKVVLIFNDQIPLYHGNPISPTVSLAAFLIQRPIIVNFNEKIK